MQTETSPLREIQLHGTFERKMTLVSLVTLCLLMLHDESRDSFQPRKKLKHQSANIW